jgi:hypothetical protein
MLRTSSRGQKIDLWLAILPEKNDSFYGNISYSKISFFIDYGRV